MREEEIVKEKNGGEGEREKEYIIEIAREEKRSVKERERERK